MRNALEGFEWSVKIGGKTAANLQCADEIVLIAGSMKELETLFTNVNLASEQAGLKLNTQNKKVMKVPGDLIINSENIETVKKFIYLDANFINGCNDSIEIRRRLAIARNAVITINDVWKDRSLVLKTKIRVLNTLVFTVAMYGCECCVIKKTDEKRLDSFEVWCYRRILRMSWRERKSNEWVLQKDWQSHSYG